MIRKNGWKDIWCWKDLYVSEFLFISVTCLSRRCFWELLDVLPYTGCNFIFLIFIFLGVYWKFFSPILATDINQVSQIPHYFGIFYFASSMDSPKFCQYFAVGKSLIDINTKIYIDSANSNSYFSFNNTFPFSLS